MQSKEIDSVVYDSKVRINHWHDKMMEHKKIYYAAELKMYKLELALAKWDNSNKLRYSVRHREMSNLIHHEPVEEKPKRRTPEPAYGYIPLTRTLTTASKKDEEGASNEKRTTTIKPQDDANDEEEDDNASSSSSKQLSAETGRRDDIPVHSEDYKPFSSTPSIHSYMYHLRKIYGK